MIKLYGGARSRASIVRWYLEELQVPYEFILLDMAAGEHRQPEFLKLNPFGKVPTLVDGDFVLYESGAILSYLDDKYGKDRLSIEQQALRSQWIAFANSTLATGIFVETSRDREMPKLMPPLNDLFAKQAFILGDEFSVADVAVGAMLLYIPLMLKLDLSAYPDVVKYMNSLRERPAYQKAMS